MGGVGAPTANVVPRPLARSLARSVGRTLAADGGLRPARLRPPCLPTVGPRPAAQRTAPVPLRAARRGPLPSRRGGPPANEVDSPTAPSPLLSLHGPRSCPETFIPPPRGARHPRAPPSTRGYGPLVRKGNLGVGWGGGSSSPQHARGPVSSSAPLPTDPTETF